MHSNIAMPVSSYDYINQLLAIIDSRLQFIGYKMKEFSISQVDPDLGSSRSDSMSFIQQADLTFQIIERMTRQKSLLLLIRKHINNDNLDVIYNLLQNDIYLNHTTKSLTNFLTGSAESVSDNIIPRAATA